MARTGWWAALAVAMLIGPLLQCGFASNASAPVVVAVRFSQNNNEVKLVFDLSRPVNAIVSALASPDRIVVDLPEVNFQLDPAVGRTDALSTGSFVHSFRFGPLARGKSRIVIDLSRAACPSDASTKAIVEGEPAARLTIELKPCDPSAFAALARSPTVSTDGGALATSSPQPVIVLDPGHGGIDSGARGLNGVEEKTLVFDFCAELERQLAATKRYVVVVTRGRDQYVDLDDRVAIARKAGASLFISVHADTLAADENVNGSTVYTVADHASDTEAARIAARENAADRDPRRANRQENADIADILFDLKRRETRTYAHIFSRGLISTLRSAVRLNHNPERSAGFVVLKAPEFPSVLVELGYLSNAQDVQSLSSPGWRTNTAAAMVAAINAFFAGSATADEARPIGGAASSVEEPTPAVGH